MKIGITRCNICGKEEELTKDDFIELLEDCDTIERIKSFISYLQLDKDIILFVLCPDCEKEFNLANQQWSQQEVQQ